MTCLSAGNVFLRETSHRSGDAVRATTSAHHSNFTLVLDLRHAMSCTRAFHIAYIPDVVVKIGFAVFCGLGYRPTVRHTNLRYDEARFRQEVLPRVIKIAELTNTCRIIGHRHNH